MAEDLGVALGAAHQAGVVHRDLKPENVLLTERPPLRGASRDGSWLPGVKLADFGTALRFGDLDPIRARQAVTGTLAYMAPEQLAGENVGPSADFYSLGVLLHEARFGLRPAKGNESPHPILERRTEERFLELVSHCLAKNPKERLSSADEFLHEVHDVGAELGELP